MQPSCPKGIGFYANGFTILIEGPRWIVTSSAQA
jgi:hypothetical protein